MEGEGWTLVYEQIRRVERKALMSYRPQGASSSSNRENEQGNGIAIMALKVLDSASSSPNRLTLPSETNPVAGDPRTIFWECMNWILGTSIGPYRDNEP